MTDLIWLHEDALRREHPVFDAAEAAARAYFIWDDAYLQQMDYGFKRLLFIYETLIELPVTIVRGNQLQCLTELAAQNGGRILVPASANPALQQTIERLRLECEVKVVADRAFVSLSQEPDLKRFFRYWKKSRNAAMSPDGGRENELW